MNMDFLNEGFKLMVRKMDTGTVKKGNRSHFVEVPLDASCLIVGSSYKGILLSAVPCSANDGNAWFSSLERLF